MIVTSNLAFSRWGETLGDDVVAAGTIDRLIHHAHVIPGWRLLPHPSPPQHPTRNTQNYQIIETPTRGVNAQVTEGRQNSRCVDTATVSTLLDRRVGRTCPPRWGGSGRKVDR